MAYDPKYKMRHKPPRIERLLHYKTLPPHMVGDPEPCYINLPPSKWGKRRAQTLWEKRCEVVYEHMMMQKRGGKPPTPPHRRRGLWAWSCGDGTGATAL